MITEHFEEITTKHNNLPFKTQKYREALEEIAKVGLSDGKSREHYQTEAVYMKITALKALEESK